MNATESFVKPHRLSMGGTGSEVESESVILPATRAAVAWQVVVSLKQKIAANSRPSLEQLEYRSAKVR